MRGDRQMRVSSWRRLRKTAVWWALLVAVYHVSSEEGGQDEVDVDYALSVLEERTQRSPARLVVFREERIFPFKTDPVILKGEIRIDEGLGASILYPEKQVAIIIDDEGLLLRRFDSDGGFRQRTVKQRQAGVGAALLPLLLRFDREALEERFTMKAEGTPNDWRLNLYPKDGFNSDLERVELSSDGQRVRRIEIALPGGRIFRILPQEEHQLQGFSQEARERHFR